MFQPKPARIFARRILGDEHLIYSAGSEALGSDGVDLNGMVLKDRASSKYAIEVMKELGIDISNNIINRLTQEMVDEADKIIVILKPEEVPEFLSKKKNIIYWDIADPDEQTLEFYRQTRNKVNKFVDDLFPVD